MSCGCSFTLQQVLHHSHCGERSTIFLESVRARCGCMRIQAPNSRLNPLAVNHMQTVRRVEVSRGEHSDAATRSKFAGPTPQSMWHAGRTVRFESATRPFRRARTLPVAATGTTFASCIEVTGARASLLDPFRTLLTGPFP